MSKVMFQIIYIIAGMQELQGMQTVSSSNWKVICVEVLYDLSLEHNLFTFTNTVHIKTLIIEATDAFKLVTFSFRWFARTTLYFRIYI